MKKLTFPVLMICLCVQACVQNSSDSKINSIAVSIDSLKFRTYADTIVCDMVVKTPDKDDATMEQWLGRLQRKAFLDSIFSDVYHGK